MDLLKAVPAALPSLSSVELDGTDLRDIEVRREWEDIDLVIISQKPRFAVAIENKIDSEERQNQLDTYKQKMEYHFPDVPKLYIYLTRDRDEPSVEPWKPYSYADIHRVLKPIRDAYQNVFGGDDFPVLLNHYLSVIETQFMNDPTIDGFCQQIYTKHWHAFELIRKCYLADLEPRIIQVLTHDSDKLPEQIKNEAGIPPDQPIETILKRLDKEKKIRRSKKAGTRLAKPGPVQPLSVHHGQAIDELCRRIYKDHWPALELIRKRKK
jgi:hypothetical protein